MSDEHQASQSEPAAGDDRSTEDLALPEVAEENARLRAELAETKAEVATQRRGRLRRTRSIAVGVLVFLAVVSLVVGAVGVWVHRTVFNTDQYVALVGPIAEDPQVQEALATYTTTQVFDALQLESRLESALPGPLNVVVGPVTNAARNYVHDAARRFFASPGFQQLWIQINTVAHEKVVALINGDYEQLPNVSITGGEVRLNTIPIITEVLRQLAQSAAGLFGLNVTIPQISASEIPEAAKQKLEQALGVTLPPDFGQITIMQQSQLNDVQNAVRWFDRLVYAVIALAVILIVLALVLSTNRRRTLIALALGLVVGLLLFRGLVRVIESRAVDAVTNPTARGAVRNTVADVAANLRTAGTWLLVIGIVAAIVAYLAGRPRWFMSLIARTRRAVAERPSGSEVEQWVAAHADALRWGGAIVAAILLFLIGLNLLPLIVIGVLLALYLWGISVLERRGRAVLPPGDGPPAGPGDGAGSAVGSAVEG
jgi:hypothetical protein